VYDKTCIFFFFFFINKYFLMAKRSLLSRCSPYIACVCRDPVVRERTAFIYLLTYLLTPWSRVLLEKLTGSAASQEIPRLFGTRRFLTVPTSARHLSLP
jgi:hypothetical protein